MPIEVSPTVVIECVHYLLKLSSGLAVVYFSILYRVGARFECEDSEMINWLYDVLTA